MSDCDKKLQLPDVERLLRRSPKQFNMADYNVSNVDVFKRRGLRLEYDVIGDHVDHVTRRQSISKSDFAP